MSAWSPSSASEEAEHGAQGESSSVQTGRQGLPFRGCLAPSPCGRFCRFLEQDGCLGSVSFEPVVVAERPSPAACHPGPELCCGDPRGVGFLCDHTSGFCGQKPWASRLLGPCVLLFGPGPTPTL